MAYPWRLGDSVELRWYHLGSRPVRVLQAGTPQSAIPEIVIVPGLGALGYLLPMVRACSTWTRVHLLDVPGFGHRRTSRYPAALADVASVVAQWLRAVPERRIALAGHSTGAQAALHAVLAVPDWVGAVVLAGPTFPPEVRRWGPLIVQIARTLPRESLGEVLATFPEYLRGRRRLLTLLRTSMADEPERHIADLGCPVVVMRGERDAVSPAAWGTRLAGDAARGRLVTVPGAHNFTYTAPKPASTALREALTNLPGSPFNH
jgi:pimeloyl-ACP methyl ester carboxylesterase